MEPRLKEVIDEWKLPPGKSLTERVDEMIRPALMAGHFGSSPTLILCGAQYHLGGEKDTEELASLTHITSADHVLDVCCFLDGPDVQLAETFKCKVTGIDISKKCIAAANNIAKLCELDSLVNFCVADAGNLPFANGRFTVVWSQCSLSHDERWLREFDRVLADEGRLALTFAIRKGNPSQHSPRWTLQDVVSLLRDLGYSVNHAEDITERDIEIGWKALDRQLSEQEALFTRALGEDWVRNAHRKFTDEIRDMREGGWGNGRIVAKKRTS